MKFSIRALVPVVLAAFLVPAQAADRPNILWLVSEDHSPYLGVYGDTFAKTPNLDALAGRSLRFTRATSTSPVCAPARTTLISGVYASSAGAHHMRSQVEPPSFLKFYPELMREAGYRCTNNAKTDYNFIIERPIWDESSNQATYRTDSEQPFLAVFNMEESHESRLHHYDEVKNDPADVPVPPYFPDTPEVRRDLARYYDQIAKVDRWVGDHLEKLEESGLQEDTIVFFYSDHGGALARGKRYPGWSGLHVPLIVYFPEKWRHLAPEGYEPGQTSDRLVSFVDFAPTLLSLAGEEIPDWMQGSAFLGENPGPAPDFAYGFRGRMDERIDACRSVTDGRYMYIRNFMPHLSHGQRYFYQQRAASAREWRRQFEEGKLEGVQAAYWEPRAPEELFDLESDPYETKNLAGDPAHAETLKRFRAALRERMTALHDLALMPEPVMHRLLDEGAAATAWDLARQPDLYPLEQLLDVADFQLAAEADEAALRKAFGDESALVRYWAAMDLLHREANVTLGLAEAIAPLLDDAEPVVRVVAAEALAIHAEGQLADRAIETLLPLADAEKAGFYEALHALNALHRARPLPEAAMESLKGLDDGGTAPAFGKDYVPELLKHFFSGRP